MSYDSKREKATIKTAKRGKSSQIAQEIRDQIGRQIYKPGEQLPSFVQLRRQYGVAPLTAERIYAQLEQEQLVVREQGRGTFVAVPPLRTKTGFIGFVGAAPLDQRAPYWMHLMQGVQEAAERSSERVLLLKSTDTDSTESWNHVDGILMATAHPKTYLRYIDGPLPCVSLLFEVPDVASVVADDQGGIRLVMEHLLGLGHRRIAYLISGKDMVSRHRLAGYTSALHEAGIEADPRWVYPISSGVDYVEKGLLNMKRWLSQGWEDLGCTALLAHNDEAAIGAIQALRAANISVPEDVSVVGFDGTEASIHCTPRLTTVRIPLEEIGRRGMELLLRKSEEPITAPETHILPTRLLVRESTAPPKK